MKIPTIRFRFEKHSIKYLPLDFAVMLILAAVSRKFLGEETTAMIDTPIKCDATLSATKDNTFKIGDLVEVHGPRIIGAYAVVARIDRVNIAPSDCSMKYDLRADLDGTLIEGVASSDILGHPSFSSDTPAMCEHGTSIGIKYLRKDSRLGLVPCKVLGKSSTESEMLYVRNEGLDNLSKYLKIHVSRVRRIVDDSMPTSEESEPNYDGEEYKHFQEGEMVEFYSEDGYTAIPAIIRGVVQDGKHALYELEHGTSNAVLSGADPDFIHSYEVYEHKTDAMCHVGPSNNVKILHCTVYSNLVEKDGTILYQVTYLDDGDVWVTEYLSYLRVERVLPGRNEQWAKGA